MTLTLSVAVAVLLLTIIALAGMVHHLSRQLRDLEARQKATSIILAAHIKGTDLKVLTWPTREEPHE